MVNIQHRCREKITIFYCERRPAAYEPGRDPHAHAQMIELTILSKSNIRPHILMLMCEISVRSVHEYTVQLQFSELKSKVALHWWKKVKIL